MAAVVNGWATGRGVWCSSDILNVWTIKKVRKQAIPSDVMLEGIVVSFCSFVVVNCCGATGRICSVWGERKEPSGNGDGSVFYLRKLALSLR